MAVTKHMATDDSLTNPIKAEWYYVGHYGQLGPLTLEQMAELAGDGVIDAETYVWKIGMADWVKAVQISELTKHVYPTLSEPMGFGGAPTPPPSPGTRAASFNTPPGAPTSYVSPAPAPTHFAQQGFQDGPLGAQTAMRPFGGYGLYTAGTGVPVSDKNRYLAGVLSLLVPGLGRIYLGYFAHGALQLILALCGLGFVWSFFDAIFMLCGAVQYDGYGRKLN